MTDTSNSDQTTSPLDTVKQFASSAADEAIQLRDTAVTAVEPLIERGKGWYESNPRRAKLIGLGVLAAAVVAVIIAAARSND